MYKISITKTFSGAHNLRNYKKKCESLHGHNWKVQATLQGNKLNKPGMLYDFSDLKQDLNSIVSYLDHKYLNEISPFDKINPTAENIAKFIYNQLKSKIKSTKLKILQVTVWENENSCATYS